MIDWTAHHRLRITCSPGLADYLRAEIEAHNHTIELDWRTGMEISATPADAMRLCLHLRTALHVMLLLNEFDCNDADELYRTVRDLPWEELISPDGYISIDARAKTETIRDDRFAGVRVKDGIVDRLMAVHGRRPNSGPERDNVVIHLDWQNRTARLWLSMSGRKLTDRGYRRIAVPAPMRENLAAGVLLAAKYDGTAPLVNPMCGSGTIAIEAALLATGRPPGLLRSNFGFMHLIGFDDDAWQTIRRQEKRARADNDVAPIIASDIDERAIDAARKNAETAGVHRLIKFETCDFAETTMPDGEGIVIMNPEYGQRMGEIAALETTYKRIGDFLKQRCAGWTGYIFTGNRELAKKVGLRASRRMEFHNAALDCRLLKYELYKGTREAYANPPPEPQA